jgi:iron(III) transport system ATP-binding protein
MRTEIRRIQQEVGITAIYVTHDQSEAMALSDQIIVMRSGVIEQLGTPQEIYYRPTNEFVAGFIGEANFLRGKMLSHDGENGTMEFEGHRILVNDTKTSDGNECVGVLRPESAHLASEGSLRCKVVLSCFMGAYQNYHVMVGDTLIKLTEYDIRNKPVYSVGDECFLQFAPDAIHIL